MSDFEAKLDSLVAPPYSEVHLPHTGGSIEETSVQMSTIDSSSGDKTPTHGLDTRKHNGKYF